MVTLPFKDDWVQFVIRASIGVPYWYGGKVGNFPFPSNAPGGEFGLDCSGYAQHCMRALGRIGHGHPWMSAQGMYDTSTPISAGRQQPGDLAFYASGSNICHVVVVSSLPHSDGYSNIIGANGGGSTTEGDDPGANVREDDNYWRDGFRGFRRVDGLGMTENDYWVAVALWVMWLKGVQTWTQLPQGHQGWDRVKQAFAVRDGASGHFALSEVYAPFLAMNNKRSTWGDTIGWSAGVLAGAASAAAAFYDQAVETAQNIGNLGSAPGRTVSGPADDTTEAGRSIGTATKGG